MARAFRGSMYARPLIRALATAGKDIRAGCISHASALFPRRSELSAGIETLDLSDDDEHGEREHERDTCVAITRGRARAR